ncbi:TonB-dependent receptor [Sphingomonas flavalba]|uniref:TonB-dependent receptor n=1 Tax=Sphingomonas flavalba TaxID=2559804 RepID=UPI0039E176D4
MLQSFAPVSATRGAPGFLALGCVGFIASAPVHAADVAADADDARGPGTIIVTGEHLRNAEPDSPKAIAPLLDTPRSIVVLDSTVIKETGSASLVEALRTVPGITFGAAEGGNPVGDRPFIRGFDSQGSTYLDGVRDIGAQNREIFAVEQVQVVRGSDSTLGGRGGAGGSLNIVSKLPKGENFVAGDVSIGTADYKRVTVDANYRLTDTIAVRLNGMWHDQDVAGRDAIWQKRWGVAPSLTIGIGTPTRLTFSYYHLDTEELPDSGIPFLYTLTNTPNLGKSYSEPAISKVTTIDGTTGVVKRSAFYGLKSRDFRNSKTDQATMRAEHDFGGVTLRNTSRFSHTAQDYIFLLPDDSQNNVYGTSATPSATNLAAGGGYVWRRGNTRYGYTDALINQTDLFGSFDTGAIKHSFAVGGELSWEKAVRGSLVSASGSSISPRCSPLAIARYYCVSLFNPDPNDPWENYSSDTAAGVPTPIVRGGPATETRTTGRTQALYAFDSITIAEPLIVNLGIRYDRFRSKILSGGNTLARTDSNFNYQAGVIFKPTPQTSLYASIATSATPPNSLIGEGSEQNGLTAGRGQPAVNPDDLKAEKTKSYEIGAKASLFDAQLSLNAAIFRTETKNARALGDNSTVSFIGEKRVDGIELGFNGNITPWWNVFGGYTYLDAKITDGGFTALTAAAVGGQAAQTVLVPSVNTGKRFPQTAKHTFTLWTNVQPVKGFSIGGGAFHTSRVFGGYQDDRRAVQDATGTVTVIAATKELARTVPGYWRFDARASLAITPQVLLSVNVQNLTNKVYFNQVYTSHYASIAAGRSAFATLALKY